MAPASTGTQSDVELPSYVDATDRISGNAVYRTQHSYSLQTSKGKPWLSLHVSSRAVSAKVLPVFRDGDKFAGEVKVDLEKPEGYKGITIGIIAELTEVGQESIPFIELSTTLWAPSSSSAKLSGSHAWPFTLTLPKTVQVAASPKESTKEYPLPPTFSERASPAYIDYKLVVTVRRGIFKVNQILSTSFAFVPRWIAPSPTPLRLASYRDGIPLIGPDGDPEGWKTLPSVTVSGVLFDTKPVDIEVSLALATPLSYAIGSPIPLFLTLKSADTQALDLLSHASTISVYLTRMTAIGSTATDDSVPRRSNNTFLENQGRAYWWPNAESAPEECLRTLQGEIDVPKTLKPSFVFPRFLIRYYVTFSVFSATGFTSATPKDQHLISEKISIVTDNAPGVILRSHAPPGYVRPSEGDYNNSMGYLENGNQRFYHHHQR